VPVEAGSEVAVTVKAASGAGSSDAEALVVIITEVTSVMTAINAAPTRHGGFPVATRSIA